MSRLLARLDAELSQCRSPARWVEIHAERACYFARLGRFAEAKSIVEQLRQKYGDALLGRGIIRVMIAEGLVSYFSHVSVSARDRFFRAYLVSTLTADPDLGRLACAWAAHVDFDQGNYGAGFENIEKAFDGLDRTEFSTVARLGLIIGDAYLYVGDRTRAQFWYERARHASVDDGDQAALGAVMYNRAAFGTARLAIERISLGREIDEQMLRFCEMELDSAWEFQKGTNVRSLTHLIDVCRARIYLLQRRFVDAKKLLAHHESNIGALEDRPNHNQLTVELVYATYMSGDESAAAELLGRWDFSELKSLDVDDRLIVIGLLQSELRELAQTMAWYPELEAVRTSSLDFYSAECEDIRARLELLDTKNKSRFDLKV